MLEFVTSVKFVRNTTVIGSSNTYRLPIFSLGDHKIIKIPSREFQVTDFHSLVMRTPRCTFNVSLYAVCRRTEFWDPLSLNLRTVNDETYCSLLNVNFQYKNTNYPVLLF